MAKKTVKSKKGGGKRTLLDNLGDVVIDTVDQDIPGANPNFVLLKVHPVGLTDPYNLYRLGDEIQNFQPDWIIFDAGQGAATITENSTTYYQLTLPYEVLETWNSGAALAGAAVGTKKPKSGDSIRSTNGIGLFAARTRRKA